MQGKTKRGPVELVSGDITAMDTDAIVNPSNTSLILGAGVSGAIALKGGPSIQQEMSRIGGCPVGGAIATGAGALKARYVIHAVGPMMGEGDEDEKLRSATMESLKRAEELKISSITFPAISTGIYGFPLDRCARVMLSAVLEHFNTGAAVNLKRVVFCLWGAEAFGVFEKTLAELEP
ncbi:MAG: macro domain-containing protein [Nitrospinae bacterium]|nr:macro domain-containing protein [Nitrospinota bacterium]